MADSSVHSNSIAANTLCSVTKIYFIRAFEILPVPYISFRIDHFDGLNPSKLLISSMMILFEPTAILFSILPAT